MYAFINFIKEKGINGDIITKLIELHKDDRARMLNLYERYKADVNGVPILQRKPVEYEENFETGGNVRRIDDKVNNTLNNSFDAEIVDTKIGYLFGHPISYTSEKKPLQEAAAEFIMRNNAEDADAELGKKTAICGKGARLLYINKDGQEAMRNIDPWETIFLTESSITEPTYALRYYPVSELLNGEEKQRWMAEFYDETNVHYYKSNYEGSKFEYVEEKPHMFEYCPLFGPPNNEEMKGDAEKVLNLIDAYDRTLSDANNEIEQYRLAYLILKGVGADEETMNEMKRSGIFQLMDEKEDLSYLTKDVNNQMIEDHLNRLEENIMRFAKSVNFSDEQFAGTASGVALKFKMLGLENKSIVMERKMSSALRYQFKVLCSAWSKRKGIEQEDYLDIWFGFKRNLPMNILEEADASLKLKGIVSEETRLSLLSFIDDMQYEMQKMEEEKDAYFTETPVIEDTEVPIEK
ncbi:phage portal protein [Psychrobacillus psychrotolerans]|uniref:phage portal protein n=1 Tax=Psychrobacillus psychrotolerans TaxID=126156 RepID=UPI003B011857